MLGSGISSEAIWTPFDALTTAEIRPLRFAVFVAWTRVEQVSAFATVGSSVVGGMDIVQGVGEVGINNADIFSYFNETDRVIRIEYERQLLEPLGGMSIALAHVVLDNTDLRFTPEHNATIGTAIKPNRPVKIFIGFHVEGQDKLIPIIEGLTLQPKEDKGRRTVTFTVVDYLRWLNEKPQETTIYTDQRSDEIVQDILSRAGVGSSAYQLDEGLNTVGFAWFEKGQTAGERIRQLCEAEEAVFYQDEQGILRFENRDKYSQAPHNSVVWQIDPGDVLEWGVDESSEVINRVIVSGKPRSVKGEVEVWRNGVQEEINAGQTIEIWAEFKDPVTGLTTPSATTDYTAFTGSGGTGSDITADISIVMTTFTTSAKLEITNNNASKAYLNLMRLRGTPATIDYEIAEVFQDTVSISAYNEHQKEINNPFIDDADFAANMAQNITRRHKDPSDKIKLRVKGIPQLQLRDQVRVKDMDLDTYDSFRVVAIQGVMEGAGFTQMLTVRRIDPSESL